MINLIKKIFGIGPKVDLAELVKNGALIVDVRTPDEFRGGHAKGAVNIPLDQIGLLQQKVKNKEQVIITCCASGMRSATAKGILRSKGFSNVHNGGSWYNLRGLKQ
ncbi:MAG: rhodanese-like domain-containing protein [Bacteroidia bacterium]|nr:rhodanese-like domain-containing protein [Bacteroidia bacterium]